VNIMPNFTARTGPMHLLFNTPGNVYVLPSGFSVVDAPPPLISELAPSGDGSGNLAIAGQQFTPSTQIWFDGLPAIIQSQKSNLLIVTPPAAPAGYTAAVTAFNSDGQSSLFFSPTATTYTYASGALSFTLPASPSLVVSPSVIPAGGAVTVDIEGTNTNFQDSTTIGFGTSDVQVGQINVISPIHMTVTVTPNVSISSANITVTTGLEVISQAVGSQITTTNSPQ
jgi:hypothetical protein